MTAYLKHRLGNYRLLNVIGQGGFADVYLGEHIHLNTLAAIKVLQMRLAGNNLEQFRNEARIIANLAHPNIVHVLDFGIEENTPYLVMEYANNGTLRQRNPKGMPLSPLSIVPYLQQTAGALQYAHDRKLVHRDIKPENMLRGSNNQVLLSDFGLDLITQSTGSRSSREMGGTVPYMAPEQLQGRPRPASDQYSLGIVVYEWLSGDRPFHGTFTEIASQQMLVSPPPLRNRIAGISPGIEQVVLRALAKDPQQRFASIIAIPLNDCNDTFTFKGPIDTVQVSWNCTLPAPVQLSPASGTVFNIYPRTTTLQWTSVQGAASYTVQIYYYQPGDTTCSGGAQDYLTPDITNTSYTFIFVGAQPGCWRVWAVDAVGRQSPASGWWEFSYTI
jgi:serine/threonine protein kinase